MISRKYFTGYLVLLLLIIQNSCSPDTDTKFTVTFESNGGSVVQAIVVEANTTITKPTNPTRTGYTFDNWYTDAELSNVYDFSSPVTANTTLYAKWNIKQYTTTFESNGGSTLQDIIVDSNTTITKPTNPTRTGYTFENWYADTKLSTVYDFSDPVTKDQTLYAKWNIKQYTITFESNGGSTVQAIKTNYNTTITKPENPTRTGYTFGNWYTDIKLSNVYDFSSPVTKNQTLYAKWNIKTYITTFDVDGGNIIEAIATEFNTAISQLPTPTKQGGIFEGWYTDATKTEAYDFSSPITKDQTLYAKWSYMVTYDLTTQTITGLNPAYESQNNVHLVIPDSIDGIAMTTIKNDAFERKKNLVSLSLPNTITHIEIDAFYDCTELKGNLVLPNGIISIGISAFGLCKKLTGDITIPKSVTTVGSLAFSFMDGISSFIFESDNPASITFGSIVFSGTPNLNIKVPSSALVAYKSADGINTYASSMTGY